MSENLVNQLTLSYMISKQQLAKLNKKIKEDNDNSRASDRDIYRKRIIKLFNGLLNDEEENLTEEVKYAFTFFIDKSIYFFKQRDKSEELEKQRKEEQDNNYTKQKIDICDNDDNLNCCDFESQDKIDYNSFESNDSMETDDFENKSISSDLEEDTEKCDKKIITTNNNRKFIEELCSPTIIQTSLDNTQNILKKTSKKKQKSEGVENIEDIQVNWFQSVQQQYKSNKIIPRKKDIIIAGHYHNK
jgi:hypothetical protein